MNYGTDETADRTENVKINEVSDILIAAGLLAHMFHSLVIHHSNCDSPWEGTARGYGLWGREWLAGTVV